MKTFLLAICILLIMLGAILLVNRYLLHQVDIMADALASLPPPDDVTCRSETAALEAKWWAVRPLVSVAVNGRTVGEIDRLIVSLRVTAVSDPVTANAVEWERYRSLLQNALRDLRLLLGCGIWEIV